MPTLPRAWRNRLNRLPEKAYIEFLNLIGTRLHPPKAAGGLLRFTLSQPAAQALEITPRHGVTVSQPGAEVRRRYLPPTAWR